MKNTVILIKKDITFFILPLLFLVGVYLTSFHSYVLFHSIIELVSILIFYSVFILAWNARKYTDNNYLLFIGIAYLFIGSIDLIHTLAYKGMGVFVGFGANLPTQLWIAARYLQGFTLFIAPFTIGKRRYNLNILLILYTVITVFLFASIFLWKIFPDCYIDGVGLTSFKKISEYVISFILLISAVLLVLKRESFDKNVLRLLVASIILTIGAELAFTFYIGVYDLSNMIGHYFKIIAAFFIYLALVQTGFEKPFSLLFRSLNQKQVQITELNDILKLLNKILRHDILNNLTIIEGNIKMYVDSKGKEGSYQDALLVAERSKHLVDQMRNLETAVSLGKSLKPYKVRETINGVIKDFSNIKFTINGNGIILADEAFVSVIENIIRNAKIHGQTGKIDIKIYQEDNFVKISISDYGKGIPDKIKKKLFTEGFKYGETGHTGLGLYIVKKTVERYGGEIWVKDNKPKGTIFIIQIKKAKNQELR